MRLGSIWALSAPSGRASYIAVAASTSPTRLPVADTLCTWPQVALATAGKAAAAEVRALRDRVESRAARLAVLVADELKVRASPAILKPDLVLTAPHAAVDVLACALHALRCLLLMHSKSNLPLLGSGHLQSSKMKAWRV